MGSVNKAILVGNLGKEPEFKSFESGFSVCEFTLATSDSYKDKAGEKITNTEWHNCKALKGMAEIISKYAKKGSKMYLEGKIKTESWEDNEGNKKSKTVIIVSNFLFLTPKSSNNDNQNQNNHVHNDSSFDPDGYDSINDSPY